MLSGNLELYYANKVQDILVRPLNIGKEGKRQA